MGTWYDITRDPDYQTLSEGARSNLKQEFFNRTIAKDPEFGALSEDAKKATYLNFFNLPDDTGQGQLSSMVGSAARGFGEVVPGAIQGLGALTGISPLETAGESIRSGIESVAPVNPLYADSIPVKGAGVGGQIISVLGTGGIGGLAGKALGAERIAAGATAAEQALATTNAVTKGANAALYGSAGLQGAASGAQLADQYGLEGGNRYANILAGAAGEIGSEMLPFGLGAETAAAKRLLGAAPQTGRALGAIGSEAGEEGINQLWQNAALKALAPEGANTPGLTEGVLESAAYGGLGGGILAGVNVATGAYRQPEIAAAADLVHSAATTSEETPLTTAAAEQTVQAAATVTAANDLTRYMPPAELQSGLTEAPQPDLSADAFAGLGPQTQNEPAITAPVGGAIPTVGQAEAAAIQSEQQLPDSGGVLPAEQPQEAGQAPSESVVGDAEVIEAPSIVDLGDAKLELVDSDNGFAQYEARDSEGVIAKFTYMRDANGVWRPAPGTRLTIAPRARGKGIARRFIKAFANVVGAVGSTGTTEGENTSEDAQKMWKALERDGASVETQDKGTLIGKNKAWALRGNKGKASSQKSKPTQTASGKKIGDKIDRGEDVKVLSEDDQSTPGMPEELTVLEVSNILVADSNKVFARRRDMTLDEISSKQEKIRQRNAAAKELGLPQEEIPQPVRTNSAATNPAITELARQAAAINAGQATGPNLNFPQIQPTVAEQPISPQGAVPTGIATQTGQPMSGDSGSFVQLSNDLDALPLRGRALGQAVNADAISNIGSRIVATKETPQGEVSSGKGVSLFSQKEEVKPLPKEIKAIHFSRSPLLLSEKETGSSVGEGADSVFGFGLYAMEPQDQKGWESMDRLVLGKNRNELTVDAKNPLIVSPETVVELMQKASKDGVTFNSPWGFHSWLREQAENGKNDAVIVRGFDLSGDKSKVINDKIRDRINELWKPVFPKGKTDGKFINGDELNAAVEKATNEITGLTPQELEVASSMQNQIFIPPNKVGIVASEAGETASADIESKALEILLQKRQNLSATVAAKAKKYFVSRNSKDLEGISTGLKTAINHSLQEADPQELHAQLAKDRADEARARKMEEDDRKADEEMAKRQTELSSKRSTAWDSVVGTPTGVEMNAVSEADGQEALAAVNNSGDVPGVLNAFVGTSGQFLANPENETNFPDLWKILSAGRVDEGNFAYGRAFVFTDGIGVNASDRRNAARLGVTPAVAAVRRVLVHESLVHRGIYGLPAHLQMQVLQWVRQNTTPEQLDNLARDYPQYENWRNNPQQMLGLCEEYLAKTVEKITTFPKDGPLSRLFDLLRDIWRWVTGETGEPTVQNLRDVIKLLKAGVVAADAKLVNDGKIDIKESNPSAKSALPSSDEYLKTNDIQGLEGAEPSSQYRRYANDYLNWRAKGTGLYLHVSPFYVGDTGGRMEAESRPLQTRIGENDRITIDIGNPIPSGFKGDEATAKKRIADAVDEEIIHASDLLALKAKWEAEGSPRSLNEFVAAQSQAAINDVLQAYSSMTEADRESLDAAMRSSFTLYKGEAMGMSLPDFIQYLRSNKGVGVEMAMIAELTRQVIQLRQTGGITETGWRSIAKPLIEWIQKMVDALRVGAQKIRDGQFGKLLKARVDEAESQLQALMSGSTIKSSRPSFANPINAELARAAERFRQMNERQAVETPEGLKELFNPNAQGSGTTNKLFEQQVTPQQIRSEIRAAYDRAIQGSGSVQAPIQQVFNEVKTQIPTLTEKQFGEQLQALYEDGSAFLVPADRSDTMLAAGEKWGVYDASGMPASYVGVMPSEVKASRVSGDVINKQRTDYQKNKVTGKSVEYQGHAPINSQGEVIDPIWRTEEQYAPKERMADKFVNEVADSLDDLTELPEQIRNDTYLREIGAEYDGDFQTLLQAQAARLLRQKADAATDPEEKQKLQDASDKATAFLRQSATRAGVNLNMVKQIQKDARFAGMFALDMVKTAKKEDQAAVVDPNFSQAAAGAVEDLSDKSNKEASDSIESDLNAQKEESEIEAGEALLNPRQRTIWERMKDILRLRARIAKAKLLKVANIKASNAAESQADVARFVQMSDKELADLDAKLSKEFDSLSNEFFGREKPKKGVRKKTGEEKPINPVIARMVSIVATKLGGGTNLEAALEALMPESPSYKDKIVNDIVSGIVGRVNQSIKKPQKAGALAALTKQLKTILAGNIKVEPAKETDESLGQKALKAFGYVTSNEEMVNRAWDEARVKVRENLAEMDETATARQIEDRLNALMGVIPTQLYSTPQARSVIREALEGTKFDNSKTILENATEAKAEVLSKLQEAVSKEDTVDPARWQRDQSYIINAFDSMVADLQAAKDKVTQKTKEKLLKGGKMTELQRLLDKTREGWQWKEIFSMPKAGQIRRRADMLAKVKENEAFKNLTGAEQAQLVDLLDQAWTDRKATYLGQKLKASPIIKFPWVTTQGAAKKLESATSDLLKAFNDGTYNKETFNQILAQKYGVRPIDQAAMAKAEKLAEELQDPELPDPVYAKKADELLKLLANTQDLNTAKMLNDFWVTSVLAGPRTWFDIGFAALNGLQRILVDSTALALRGDFKTAGTALSRFIGIMPQAFKEAAHFIKTGDVSLLVNSKDQFSRFLAKGLKGGQHTSTSYQLEHWDQDKAPGAPAWKKTQGAILRGIGRFMRIVERLLTALDHINATATKYGYLPISIAQNQKKYAQARLPNEKEMEQFRNQAKAYLLGGKEPANHGEQVTLDAWTRHFTDKFYSEWQDVIDGASYAGAVASGVLDPEGIVGGIYNAILGGASRATTAADALKVKADAMVNDPNVMRIDAYTQKALATLGQLAAYSVRNLLGFRFIRFGAVKFNDSLTYIPAIGLLRLAESDNKNATKRAMILNNQAFGIVLALVGGLIVKAVADDDDPKKRGFDITGSLDGLTAAEKKQLSDSGQKEYTLTLYINGKPLRLVYKTWPISAALSAIGTLTDMVQFKREKWDQKEFTDRLVAAAVVATTSTLDSASMSQFAELVGKGQYASDPDEAFVNKITRVGTNFAGGFIPRIFKDLDYWLVDPSARKYDTVWQNLGKEVPIWRTRIGAPKLDIFAQPVQTPRSPWSRAIVQQPDDEAYNTLGLLNSRDLWLTPGNPELRTVGTKNRRRGLTDEEQTRYIKLVGAGYKQVVEKYGQKILAMPKERAKSFLADKTKDVRDMAEKKAVRLLTSS